MTAPRDLKWELLSSEYKVQEAWATLRVDTCRMPDGRTIPDYYVLEYPDWVNAVALTEKGEVILIRQYRHAAGEVILELPGGCVEEGETAEEAVRRELLEETGYAFDKVEEVCELYANPATANNKTYCFLATGGKQVAGQNLDPGEDIMIEFVSVDRLKQMLINNEFAHALHASGVFYALQKM